MKQHSLTWIVAALAFGLAPAAAAMEAADRGEPAEVIGDTIYPGSHAPTSIANDNQNLPGDKIGADAAGMKPMVSGMNETQIKKSLRAAGYSSVTSLKRHSDHYNASAQKNGRLVALRIDAKTGEATEKAR
jgi:hypothetical protein